MVPGGRTPNETVDHLSRRLPHESLENSSQINWIARIRRVQTETLWITGALKIAEARRTTLLTELAALEQARGPGGLQFSPGALGRHLQRLTDELRSGVQGKVRDAIERTVGKIVVNADGTMTIEVRPKGLPGIEGRLVPLGCPGTGCMPLVGRCYSGQ
jgi:hypothetical protein